VHGQTVSDSPELAALLELQRGLAARAQLLSAGVSRDAVRWRLDRGWQLIHPGVVATFAGTLDPGQVLIAAQLYAGPKAYLSSWTAAAWYGVEAARVGAIVRLTVPAHLAARATGCVRVTRTARMDANVWERAPLRFASRARAVVDAAREVKAERVARAIVIEAVQRRVVPVAQLRHELEAGPRAGSRQVRGAIDAAEAGAWSVPEAELLDLLSGSRILPMAWGNPALASESGERLPTPDVWFDDVGLAVQVHSRLYHARDADWETTVSGDSLLGEHGVVVIGVTPVSLADPKTVLHRIERAYLAVRERERPRVVAIPLTELRWSR
jgi:hypothetical protein